MPLVKRSISLHRHRTSVALEPQFWSVLDDISTRRDIPLSALIAEIDDNRDPDDALSSSLRVFALEDLLKRQTEAAEAEDQ